ncbi:MAG: hypothetical protein D6738_15585 [Acidobacteria bacterium]|nr:MAG: hypothetical protein D6738_15585 [Acidobacteriota bacterium]
MDSRHLAAAVLAAFALLASATPAQAQYFGKNKVTWTDFEWKVYTSPHFDVHYYQGMEQQIEQVVDELESAYLDISKILDHELRERTPVILYRTHREFQNTNIQLQEIPDAVGGFSEPFQNRLVIPIDDPPDKRYKLIRHELTHIFQFDILYAGSLRRALRGQAPLWFVEGMASYIADDEDSFDQMVIRDAVVNNLMPSVRELSFYGFLAYRYGHAVFDFLEKEFGPERFRALVFDFRQVLLAQNLDKVFRDALGLSVEAFDRRFARYLRRRYLPVLTSTRSPDEYGKEIGVPKRGVFTMSPTLSPSGELVAALSSVSRLELDVVVLSPHDGEVIRNITRGFTNDWERIVSGAFEGKRDLSWSPEDDRIAFFVRKEHYTPLVIYDALRGRRIGIYRMGEIASCMSPAFSPDGRKIAFSGNLDGVWDIFTWDVETGEIVNVTSDRYVDSNPWWSADGKQLLYNRRIGQFEKVFAVEVGAPERKTQLTAGPASDLEPVLSRDGRFVYFTSDRGRWGVFNLHRLDLQSGRIERLTNLSGGAFSPVELPPAEDGAPQLAFTAFSAGTFRLFKFKVAGEAVEEAIRIGASEPSSSPLAPSRRRQRIQAIREVSALAPLPPETAAPGQPAPSGEPETGQPGQAEADTDLAPFEPPLRLGFDPNRVADYRRKWDIEFATPVVVGLANDGTVLANTTLVFSDLLGDYRAAVQFSSFDTFTNISLTYLNLKRRLDWGARFTDFRDYYLFATSDGAIVSEEATRFTSVAAFATYPLNRYFRLEGSLGFGQRRQSVPIDAGGGLAFRTFSDDFPVASLDFVGDTVRYQSFGPLHGYQFRIGLSGYTFVSGDNDGESVLSYNVDLRGYQKLTTRSLLAARLVARISDGRGGTVWGIGGINQIRGLRFRELFGDSFYYANFEFRFPLFNMIQWGFGMNTGPVRAFAFVDIGSAWFNDVEFFDLQTGTIQRGKVVFDPDLRAFRRYDAKDDQGFLRDVVATAGLGFRLPMFGLPLTWSFSVRYDGNDFGPWHSDFYIVHDW